MSLQFRQIPHVLDDYDLPFVIGMADQRQGVEMDGFLLRRGRETLQLEAVIANGAFALRALADDVGDMNAAYVGASIGPLLDEWWDVVRQMPPQLALPCMAAGVAGTPIQRRLNGVDVPVRIVPPGEGIPGTRALVVLPRHVVNG